jgi:predicted  nucleic acid-binding Zn-ribbon protein
MNTPTETPQCSHNWIGDTCSTCGIAYHIFTKNRIAQLEQELQQFKIDKEINQLQQLRDVLHRKEQELQQAMGELAEYDSTYEAECAAYNGLLKDKTNLQSQLSKAKEELAKFHQAREVLHKKFGYVPHPDGTNKCHCAYCARDFEAVADHAAELEMSEHSLREQLSQWQECAREILQEAEYGIAGERLAGNIVKEEFWKGQKSVAVFFTQLTQTKEKE